MGVTGSRCLPSTVFLSKLFSKIAAHHGEKIILIVPDWLNLVMEPSNAVVPHAFVSSNSSQSFVTAIQCKHTISPESDLHASPQECGYQRTGLNRDRWLEQT